MYLLLVYNLSRFPPTIVNPVLWYISAVVSVFCSSYYYYYFHYEVSIIYLLYFYIAYMMHLPLIFFSNTATIYFLWFSLCCLHHKFPTSVVKIHYFFSLWYCSFTPVSAVFTMYIPLAVFTMYLPLAVFNHVSSTSVLLGRAGIFSFCAVLLIQCISYYCVSRSMYLLLLC